MAPAVADPFALNSMPVNKDLAKRELSAPLILFTFQDYKLGKSRILSRQANVLKSLADKEILISSVPLFRITDKSQSDRRFIFFCVFQNFDNSKI